LEFTEYLNQIKVSWLNNIDDKIEIELELETEVISYLEELAALHDTCLDVVISAILSFQISKESKE
jgi:hypothetical protein